MDDTDQLTPDEIAVFRTMLVDLFDDDALVVRIVHEMGLARDVELRQLLDQGAQLEASVDHTDPPANADEAMADIAHRWARLARLADQQATRDPHDIDWLADSITAQLATARRHLTAIEDLARRLGGS